MKFDPSTRRLLISVRELAEDDQAFHRVGFDRSQAWRRLWLGGEAHRRLLASRQATFPGYRGEVFVSATIAIDGYEAIVSGRIDGALETEAGNWLIEEFKTCPVAPDGRIVFPPEREEFARRQVSYYAALWQRQARGRATPAIVLTDPTGEIEDRRAVAFRLDDVLAEIERRLRACVGRLEARERDLVGRRQRSSSIRFPHDHVRPVQESLMEAIDAALASGRHLLAQAPTGSGKTAAALYSAVRHALASDRRVVFLTAKTLQQILAAKTLSAMNEGSFRTLWMRAKDRMCANDRVLCHEEHCAFARDYAAKMERTGVLDLLLDRHPTLDPDTVFAAAKSAVVCPFEVEIELAARADVFVGDYNYLIEPSTALRPFAPDLLSDAILVVDEAHNLADRTRQIYSPAIAESDVAPVVHLASLSPGDVWNRLRQAAESLREFVARAGASVAERGQAIDEVVLDTDALDDLLFHWDAAIVSYFEWKRLTGELSEDDPVIALHFRVVRFGLVRRLAEGHDDFAAVAETSVSGARLRYVCLDPSRVLSRIFNAASSTILLSATLEPFEMTRRLTGLDPERTDSIRLPPPFPAENRRVLIIPTVRTTYAAREKNYEPIAEMIGRMASAHRGNSLVLFPSYRFLREVKARLPPGGPRVLAQSENATESERRQILQALASPPAEGLVLLAVAGGVYAEGVDYPGDLLSAVYVVSPSLPQVSFDRELLRRYHDDHDEPGFEYAYILPGMTRVIQAAGRLIRSETDRGVIALVCRRFLEEPYVGYLPRDWYADEPWELACKTPERAIADFFA